MSGLKAFVRRILGKPSQPAGAITPEQANEALGLLLKALRKQLESSGDKDYRLCKVSLAELILPKVVNTPPTDGSEREVFKAEVAQAWAFACAEMLGFLAGATLQEEAIDGAINEAARTAKKSAYGAADAMRNSIGPAITGEQPKPSVTRPSVNANKATKASASMLEQKRKMVSDIEAEAFTEDAKGNAAAAAALREMARIWKKEIEVEEGLNKMGKSAA